MDEARQSSHHAQLRLGASPRPLHCLAAGLLSVGLAIGLLGASGGEAAILPTVFFLALFLTIIIHAIRSDNA